jgi:putative membrane protein insertion efficiency factor
MTSAARNAARGGGRSARVLIAAIEVYRHMISPLRLPSCRFMPTCSQYAVEALTEYGLLRGGWLAVCRLARCGPWHGGGWDPIPERCVESGDGLKPEVRSAHV